MNVVLDHKCARCCVLKLRNVLVCGGCTLVSSLVGGWWLQNKKVNFLRGGKIWGLVLFFGPFWGFGAGDASKITSTW